VTVCVLIDADTCPKINAFYLRKEAELKLRLETLLSKRRAAALRVLPHEVDDTTQSYVEWKAVEEGFHLLERDLAKLQVYIWHFYHSLIHIQVPSASLKSMLPDFARSSRNGISGQNQRQKSCILLVRLTFSLCSIDRCVSVSE
jgi:hypothetical protein